MKRYARLISLGRRALLSAAFFLGCLVFGPSLVAAEVSKGLVAFFSAKACPSGWKIADYASGRLIVAVRDGQTVGNTVGTPLANHEDREHKHNYKGDLSLDYKAIAAITGCCNGNATAKGNHAYSGTTNAAASGLPFIQFPVCEKQ